MENIQFFQKQFIFYAQIQSCRLAVDDELKIFIYFELVIFYKYVYKSFQNKKNS